MPGARKDLGTAPSLKEPPPVVAGDVVNGEPLRSPGSGVLWRVVAGCGRLCVAGGPRGQQGRLDSRLRGWNDPIHRLHEALDSAGHGCGPAQQYFAVRTMSISSSFRRPPAHCASSAVRVCGVAMPSERSAAVADGPVSRQVWQRRMVSYKYHNIQLSIHM